MSNESQTNVNVNLNLTLTFLWDIFSWPLSFIKSKSFAKIFFSLFKQNSWFHKLHFISQFDIFDLTGCIQAYIAWSCILIFHITSISLRKIILFAKYLELMFEYCRYLWRIFEPAVTSKNSLSQNLIHWLLIGNAHS